MKYLLLSILAICLVLAVPVTALGDELEEDGTSFFRSPLVILWTYQGEGSSSYVLQMRHHLDGSPLLPNTFDDIGIVPSDVVLDAIYESNPTREEGDAIWSRVTMHYDELFGYEYVEGRAIYRDIELDAYLGAGVGFTPTDNVWIGGYYLGGEGFQVSGEGAYALTEDLWIYGLADYYTDSEEWEGEIGLRFQENIWASVQNRVGSYIYAFGVSQPLP